MSMKSDYKSIAYIRIEHLRNALVKCVDTFDSHDFEYACHIYNEIFDNLESVFKKCDCDKCTQTEAFS